MEKFYINNGDDLSSKTLGYLNVQGVPGEIIWYSVSQNHEFAAVYTSNNILATFKIAELVFKEQQAKPPETINFGMEGLNSDQMYQQQEGNIDMNFQDNQFEGGSNQGGEPHNQMSSSPGQRMTNEDGNYHESKSFIELAQTGNNFYGQEAPDDEDVKIMRPLA